MAAKKGKSRGKAKSRKPRAAASRKTTRRVYRSKTRARSRKRGAAKRSNFRVVMTKPRTIYVRNPRHRRRYRRNPAILSKLGFDRPVVQTVAYTALGFLGTPFVEGFVSKAIPASVMPSDPTFNKITRYAIQLASAFALGWGTGKVLGREAGRKVFIGGLVYTGVGAIREFFPTFLGPSTGEYIGSQPLLGEYPSMGSYITMDTPDRLRPENRF